MGYAEDRGGYWRGRYKVGERLETVKDGDGRTVRFTSQRAAKRAADEAEVNARTRRPVSASGQMLFGDYARQWYAVQDLAASTMQNYRRHLEEHLFPAFEQVALADITKAAVTAWERRERGVPYADSSVKTWRSTLHLVLADAVEEGAIPANPAARRRGRGRRAGRSRNRGREKSITEALGVLLIAERAALLSGRDDEFVAIVLMGYTGMRWGEVVGLETQYVRPDAVRVEWQLYELDTGVLVRCPPKDDSYRTIVVPPFLATLLREHVTRTQPKACACHGRVYAFGGHREANGAARAPGPKLVDVARLAGVSTGTVSNVLNQSAVVVDVTRAAVESAIAELGYVRGARSGELAPHWRRSGFATWLFRPAATGSYPVTAPLPPRPVPLLGEPWPGIPLRGRNASGRATACWVPIAPGLTPHGLRHSYKTVMVQLGTPPVVMDEQMGHEDGSIGARYSHVTGEMVRRLLDGLTDVWADALAARREMAPGSPVAVLNRLLREGQ